MRVIRTRNPHTALPRALEELSNRGVKRDSRNGPVWVYPEVVGTVYEKPCERVMFHPWRDANPFFHFYESLWMLAGRRDVAPLKRYAQRMSTFSDDGEAFNAAYGHRWRHARADIEYGETESLGTPYLRQETTDQLRVIIERLSANHDDRRCVLQIWDHVYDLRPLHREQTKDTACNVSATFQIGFDDRLDMTVFCRSNDIIWGCYGANAVHFSMLLEYVARSIGVEVGKYTQISVNWHAYDELFIKTMESKMEWETANRASSIDYTGESPYDAGWIDERSDLVEPYPIMTTPQRSWDDDCRRFVTDDGRMNRSVDFTDNFFRRVAAPIVLAHDVFKDSATEMRFRDALEILRGCAASDWRRACSEWIQRRWDRWQRAADGGPQTVEEVKP